MPLRERTLPFCLSPGSANPAAFAKLAQRSQQVEAPSPAAAVHSLDLQVFTHSPQPPLPKPPFPVVFFFFNAESSNPLARLAPRYQIPPEEFWARSFAGQTGLPPSPNVSPSLPPTLSLGIYPYPLQQGRYF